MSEPGRRDLAARIAAALRRAARARYLEQGKESGWPLPSRLASHLFLYTAGMLDPRDPEDPDASP